ncbi:hypothetical protein ACB092_08G072800 [Castanea dentata]
MEYHSEFKSNLRDQQPLGTSGKPLLPQASQSIKLQDRLKPEKPRLSYADLHNEITGNEKDIPPKSCHDLQKQWTDNKAIKEDELVKYMSNLPSYLERGENRREKVLNVGVLDWGRLEKWRYSHKQVPDESSQNSPSSSITSSSFWTDGSSAPSSRGQSRSPARPRAHRPSLQSHLMSSSIEGHSQEVKLFGGSIGKFQDLKPSQSSILLGQEKVIRTDQPFCSTAIKKEECRRKDPDRKIDQESTVIPNAPICTKEKTKIQDGEIKKRVEKLREPNPNNFDQDVFGKHKTVVLLLPRDLPQKHHSAVSQFSELTTSLGRRSMEASQKSFSQSSKENYHAEVHSDIPHSCPLPCEVDSEHSLLRQPGTLDKRSVNVSSVTSHPVPRSAKVGTSPSKSRNLGEKRSTLMPTNTTNEALKVLDVKVSNVADEKVRSSSPFRRLNISLGKMSKSSSSKEGLDTHRLNSTCTVAKSGTEKAVASAFVDTSNTDNLNTARARSSPLRRLLDPLLKPKAANCHHFVEPVERESITTVRASKNSNGQLDSSGKLNLDTPVQALLQVAIKNGQPLFKFAVDNDSNILAATMKKLNTTGKGEYSTVYTFFTIQVKKKNGSWINQGGKSKGKGQDYISNVVAQMKVSDSQFPNMLRQHCMDQFSMREFVLFSVDLRQADQQTFDFQPNDELAAVVIKFPKSINRGAAGDRCQGNHYNDLLEVGSKEQLPGVECYSNTGENVQKLPFVSMKNLVNATVILPSAVHSIPSKGGPSSLIERWKSGGLCDCGGWDLGCKLRILANQNQISNKLGSSKACSVTDKFELFCQEGVQVNQPFLSLSQYKDGIYSVEFSSPLSILQAFSICIAVLDSKKACELSESSDF